MSDINSLIRENFNSSYFLTSEILLEYSKDHHFLHNIRPGTRVLIVQKHHQKTGELTQGIVKNVLTKKPRHTRGIKVRLITGEVGRVQKILED